MAIYYHQNTKIYLGPLTMRTILTKFGIPRHIFYKITLYHFEINKFSESRAETFRQTDRQTDGWTDMMKILGICRD